jgi:energy-coupling factor transporter ATP-binding protein EcfA2
MEDELVAKASSEDSLTMDERLRQLKRTDILSLPRLQRLRWMYLMQVRHRELARVTSDLLELIQPDIDVTIISLIGMTGAGKTTLANGLRTTLSTSVFGLVPRCEKPVLFVKAPANGDKSFSWKALYGRIFADGDEPLPFEKRHIAIDKGRMIIKPNAKAGLSELRDAIEGMLKNRNVRVLIIDEAVHLLRFGDYATVMDTLKSLADSYSTKILLIGVYNLAKLMQNYGQVVKRGEIIHYRRYHFDIPEDKQEFLRVLGVMQGLWPCLEVPDFEIVGELLMRANLGSVGLLKGAMMRLASLQMRSKGEKFSSSFLKKAVKAKKALQIIENETLAGEEDLVGACYGESLFEDQAQSAKLKDLAASVKVVR